MKVRIGLGVVALTVMGASMAFASSSVVNSKHNMLTAVNATDTYNRVCAFCHTPHHALDGSAIPVDYNPLWSHTFSTMTFTGYDSTTIEGVLLTGDPVAGNSRLCMSCHDGVIAVDQHYGNGLGSIFRQDGDSWGGIDVPTGNSLTNDHPIGFNYQPVGGTDSNAGSSMTDVSIITGNTDGSDKEIRGTATPLWAFPTRTIANLLEQRIAGVQLMTCGSCHDVHNTFTVGTRYFLVGDQTNSQICLTCHIK